MRRITKIWIQVRYPALIYKVETDSGRELTSTLGLNTHVSTHMQTCMLAHAKKKKGYCKKKGIWVINGPFHPHCEIQWTLNWVNFSMMPLFSWVSTAGVALIQRGEECEGFCISCQSLVVAKASDWWAAAVYSRVTCLVMWSRGWINNSQTSETLDRNREAVRHPWLHRVVCASLEACQPVEWGGCRSKKGTDHSDPQLLHGKWRVG